MRGLLRGSVFGTYNTGAVAGIPGGVRSPGGTVTLGDVRQRPCETTGPGTIGVLLLVYGIAGVAGNFLAGAGAGAGAGAARSPRTTLLVIGTVLALTVAALPWLGGSPALAAGGLVADRIGVTAVMATGAALVAGALVTTAAGRAPGPAPAGP